MDGENDMFWVNGIVSHRDKKPYIQLANEKGMIAQLSMAQTRKIAMDMLVMAARTEMDAMLLNFFQEKLEASEEACGAAMMHFRDYRADLDQEQIEGSIDRGEARSNG